MVVDFFVLTQLRQNGHILFTTRIRDTHTHTVVCTILGNTMTQCPLMLLLTVYTHARVCVQVCIWRSDIGVDCLSMITLNLFFEVGLNPKLNIGYID